MLSFYKNRPEKVSFTQETLRTLEYPRITICSPAFFNKTKSVSQQRKYFSHHTFSRLGLYNLSDANDDLANYLILSLQNDMIVPKIAVIYYVLREWLYNLEFYNDSFLQFRQGRYHLSIR